MTDLQLMETAVEGMETLDLSRYTLYCTLANRAARARHLGACGEDRLRGAPGTADRYFELAGISCEEIVRLARTPVAVTADVLADACLPLYSRQ